LDLAALTASFFAGLDELSSDSDDKPVVVAAGESILRWIVLPAVSRITTPLLHWSLRSMRTLKTLEAVANGNADLAVIREDAVTNGFVVRDVGAIEYVWVFPRRILPGQTAAGIYDAKRLPFAMLAGDGKLSRQILDLSARNNLHLDIVMELESFSLLVEAVKTRNLGAVVPRTAASEFSSDEFAVVEDGQLAIPARTLTLIAHEKTHLLRPKIRKAFDEFSRAMLGTMS
jgi:DNA-binding transcriptional LysR family regulator